MDDELLGLAGRLAKPYGPSGLGIVLSVIRATAKYGLEALVVML